jgi:hypothetical protein
MRNAALWLHCCSANTVSSWESLSRSAGCAMRMDPGGTSRHPWKARTTHFARPRGMGLIYLKFFQSVLGESCKRPSIL